VQAISASAGSVTARSGLLPLLVGNHPRAAPVPPLRQRREKWATRTTCIGGHAAQGFSTFSVATQVRKRCCYRDPGSSAEMREIAPRRLSGRTGHRQELSLRRLCHAAGDPGRLASQLGRPSCWAFRWTISRIHGARACRRCGPRFARCGQVYQPRRRRAGGVGAAAEISKQLETFGEVSIVKADDETALLAKPTRTRSSRSTRSRPSSPAACASSAPSCATAFGGDDAGGREGRVLLVRQFRLARASAVGAFGRAGDEAERSLPRLNAN